MTSPRTNGSISQETKYKITQPCTSQWRIYTCFREPIAKTCNSFGWYSIIFSLLFTYVGHSGDGADLPMSRTVQDSDDSNRHVDAHRMDDAHADGGHHDRDVTLCDVATHCDVTGWCAQNLRTCTIDRLLLRMCHILCFTTRPWRCYNQVQWSGPSKYTLVQFSIQFKFTDMAS